MAFPVLKKRIIQLAGCRSLRLSPSGHCKCREGRRNRVFFFAVSPGPVQCWPGKEQGSPCYQSEFSTQPTRAKPLFCTPPSSPQLYVVRAHLHLGISESCAFNNSLGFLADQRSQPAGPTASGKWLACQLPYLVLRGFHFPLPSLWEAGDWVLTLFGVLLCRVTLSKLKSKNLVFKLSLDDVFGSGILHLSNIRMILRVLPKAPFQNSHFFRSLLFP